MPKVVKVNLALKEKLKKEAEEREKMRQERGNTGKHKTATQLRENAERQQKEKNEANAKAKREENMRILLSEEAREASAKASVAAAMASAAAAEASRAAAEARIVANRNTRKKQARQLERLQKFHRENPHHGRTAGLSKNEIANNKRGGKMTRRK